MTILLETQPLDPSWESRPEHAAFAEQLADFIEGDDEFRNSRSVSLRGFHEQSTCTLAIVKRDVSCKEHLNSSSLAFFVRWLSTVYGFLAVRH